MEGGQKRGSGSVGGARLGPRGALSGDSQLGRPARGPARLGCSSR